MERIPPTPPGLGNIRIDKEKGEMTVPLADQFNDRMGLRDDQALRLDIFKWLSMSGIDPTRIIDTARSVERYVKG
jgi:hypothetical protein